MIRDNIFISICSIFFFLSGFLLVNGAYPEPPIISLIFWSTLLIYYINTNVNFNFLNADSYRAFLPPASKKAKIVILLSGITLAHVPFINIEAILFLSHLGLISTLYNVPEKTKNLIHLPFRTIPILKIFLIAYVWASISSFLPAIIEGNPILNSQTISVFLAHFLFIIAITLPFDIRDFRIDRKNNLITFPHLIGIKLTKLLAIGCLIGFTLMIHQIIQNWHIFLFSLITAVLILNSSARRKKYYFTYFIDGTIILYFITILLSLY
jgi:4-hydroxybenzoate polyprenyltransferase